MANLVLVVFVCALIAITGAQNTCDTAAFTTCTTTYSTDLTNAGSDATKICSAFTKFRTCAIDSNCLGNINIPNPCSGCTNITYSLALIIFLGLLQIVKRI